MPQTQSLGPIPATCHPSPTRVVGQALAATVLSPGTVPSARYMQQARANPGGPPEAELAMTSESRVAGSLFTSRSLLTLRAAWMTSFSCRLFTDDASTS